MKMFIKNLREMSTSTLVLLAVLYIVACFGIAMLSPATASAMMFAPIVFGTTLAANAPRGFEHGDIEGYPMIAADIIYEGAAVGLVNASGHARPLTSADRFAGFAEAKADNSSGSAADVNVRVKKRGKIQLAVSGAVITDVGLPVYATDDNTFVFIKTSAVFIGFVSRFVSSGVVIVEFDAENFQDPWDGYIAETVSDNKTLDAQDTGKVFFVDTDAKTITLPATATTLECVIVNAGAYGTVAVNLSPQAADKVMGPDIAGTDNKDLINTKATACRGDFAHLKSGHADGYTVQRLKGTWAEEA